MKIVEKSSCVFSSFALLLRRQPQHNMTSTRNTVGITRTAITFEKMIERYTDDGYPIEITRTDAEKFFGPTTTLTIQAGGALVSIKLQEAGGLNKKTSIKRSAWRDGKKVVEMLAWSAIDRALGKRN